MEKELRILILEDSAVDAELIERELKKERITFSANRVETKEGFTKALDEFHPDLILSDYKLPSFDGLSALMLVKEKCPEIPFILVTGTLGEERAVDILKSGVTDYVLKQRLSRLGPAVHRALKEVEERNSRQQTEERQRLANKCLNLLNKQKGATDTIRNILQLIKQNTDIEVAGIRLREGEDFPYFEQSGFSEEFVEKENYLCSHDAKGNLILDEQGKPSLECMCGNVIRGRINPKLPFFTEDGSFWTNSTTDWLATTTEKDRQSPMRNRCNTAGYESVALIPLRSDDEIIGLLQLNDHRRNRFTPDVVNFYEGLAASIGIALSRKQAVEALRKTEERYRLLAETAPDIIWTVDMNMHLTYINPSVTRVLGWTVEEAMARTMKDAFTPASFEVAMRILAEEMAVEKTGQGDPHRSRMLELELFHKDGTAISVEAHLSFFRDSTGKPVGVLSVAHDITERKRAEEERKNLLEQLVRSEKLAAVGELISGVAHEINNPLTGIVGLSELLLREKKENLDEDTKKDLESIYQSSERIRKIVANLLRFARREAPVRKNVSINELLDTVLNIRSYEMKVKNVEVKKDYQPDLPPVMADSSQLEQVFLNIINNAEYAIHETGKAGTLTIATSLQEEHPEHKEVIIEISNTGAGIPENVFSKLFNPFFTTKPIGKGTGLGLSVSYGIIKEHGGEIYARNRAEGGAVFTIEFPISGGGG